MSRSFCPKHFRIHPAAFVSSHIINKHFNFVRNWLLWHVWHCHEAFLISALSHDYSQCWRTGSFLFLLEFSFFLFLFFKRFPMTTLKATCRTSGAGRHRIYVTSCIPINALEFFTSPIHSILFFLSLPLLYLGTWGGPSYPGASADSVEIFPKLIRQNSRAEGFSINEDNIWLLYSTVWMCFIVWYLAVIPKRETLNSIKNNNNNSVFVCCIN